MKTLNGFPRWPEYIFLLAVGLMLFGCGRNESQSVATPTESKAQISIAPLTLVLAPHEGQGRIDAEIRQRQDQIRGGPGSVAGLERLGWLFVAKARETYDSGFYTLAEQCALAIEDRQPHSAEAVLLRGHALHSQHRFKEAEALAQELVKGRGLAFDYGLLGDILVDLGRVDEAARAYQSMLDLKPDPQGYARAAHIRWLKGDRDGALELMRMAARGVSPRDQESAAWMHTQLARYLWQAEPSAEAARALDVALAFQSDYAPALLLRGRMLLGTSRNAEAIQILRRAAKANPLPEYLWVLSEALSADGRQAEAREVEARLASSGITSDPRTCALFLASRRENVETALSLARGELAERGDIFTHDAVAWALAATGRAPEAHAQMSQALLLGTQDSRLHFHAMVIAANAGHLNEARSWLAKVEPGVTLLLPSERHHFDRTAKLIRSSSQARISTISPSAKEFFPTVNIGSTAAKN